MEAGSELQPQISTDAELEQDRKFKAISASAGGPKITLYLILINSAVFLIALAGGVYRAKSVPDELVSWGADYGPLTAHGEWWRLLTATFLHVGLMHLLTNMFCLLIIGGFAEAMFGRVRYTILYLLAGVCGNVASLYWHPVAVAAGASGAVFGIYGAVLGFVLLQSSIIPREKVRSIGKSTLIFIAVNVLYGFIQADVDMAAHVGGFATGLLVGGAFARSPFTANLPLRWAIPVAAVASVIALAAGAALRMPVFDDYRAELNRLNQIEPPTLKLFADSVKSVFSGKMSRANFAQVVDRQIVPSWKTERERFSALRLPPGQRALADQIGIYMTLREEGWLMMKEGLLTNNPATVRASVSEENDALAILRKLNPRNKVVKKP